MGQRLGAKLHTTFDSHPHVTNIRRLGLMAGISIVKDSGTGEAYEVTEGHGAKIMAHMRDEGSVIPRIINDELLIAPPLVVNADEIDQIVGAVEAAVRAVTGD
jgi:L-2,4-diaminobutyrate transaminase